MGRKVKYSREVTFEVVKRYIQGESARELARVYGIEGKRATTKIFKMEKQI